MNSLQQTSKNTPKEIYNWKVYSAAGAAAFGGILFGFDNAFLGGTLALPSFQAQFGLQDVSAKKLSDLSSNIVITFQAGCLLACFLALPAADILGRRVTIIVASVTFLVGAAIQLTGHLPAFYIGRFMTGLGVGPLTVVCPMYISEIAPAALRGGFIGAFEVCYQFGGLLGFWINYGVSLHIANGSDAQWRVPVSIQLPLVGVLLLGALTLPETPRWLLKQDRTEEATKVLSRIRQLPREHAFVSGELTDIINDLQFERREMQLDPNQSPYDRIRALLRECLSPGIRWRISVGIVTQFIGQMSGINAINYFSPRIFRSLGVVGTHTGLFATGIYGVVKTTTAIVAYFVLVDRFGRRTLLLVGCFVMTIALFFVGGYMEVANPSSTTSTDATITSGGIAACAFVYIYVIGFVMSFAGVPWILSSECVPLSVRSISATLGAATQWLFNLVTSKAMPYMMDSIGGGTFFFFGSFVVAGAAYVWFFVPETRGIPMEHMAEVFTRERFTRAGLGRNKVKHPGDLVLKEEPKEDVQEVESRVV